MDKKTIIKEIEDLETLLGLTDAYAQISSGRMKSTRTSVLSSRDFLSEVHDIFKELQSSYREEFLSLARKRGFKKGEKITFLSHNGRSVAVFISANTGFYGDLTKRVFDSFMKEVQEKDVEATIVGSLGLAMFRDVAPNRSYSYFELGDYGFDREKLDELVKHLVEYEQINIYYGKFGSILNQTPDKISISAETPIEEKQAVKSTKYLFEPDLEEILMFFEKEMFSSVFEQTIRESQLAKFASRMLAMDTAGERIRETLENTKTVNLKLTHSLINKKQLEYLSSIMPKQRRFA